MLNGLTKQLRAKSDLTPEQINSAVEALIQEGIAAEVKADFLSALARKGETTEEITAFALELRAKSVRPVLAAETHAGEILDVCGTGGDRLKTFNISTTVALLVSAAGVTVAKHGNRAVTSDAGSADVLEALGIAIDLSPEQAGQWLQQHRFAFFFAPKYHPAFKHIAPARKLCAERQERTIFNFLGPLLNPARPTAQLVGVPRPDLCHLLASVLQALGVRRAMVVSGGIKDRPEVFLDELSSLGPTTVSEFYQDRAFASSTLDSQNYPVKPAKLEDLAGGDRAANAEMTRRILRGQDRGRKREAVLLNAAAALFVAGHARSLVEGWESAAETIDSGKAADKLTELERASRAMNSHVQNQRG
ncbi:MAG TPA: anthranilate phosphoribosyltransferase [Verrucomicrobiae bacterium]|nr:anthranilate phosphoribosyltransferase [Verrucomicrobiae bacterium]